MASIVDAFNDAFHEDKALLKILIYAIPVYFVIYLFSIGKTTEFVIFGSIVGALMLGLLTQGINNVRHNRREILTFNPILIITSIFKAAVVLIPQIIIYTLLGGWLISLKIPVEIPYIQTIYTILVEVIIFSILLTSYMAFAKHQRISDGYNYKLIFESCIDVLISYIFFVPQLVIANLVLIGPVAYLFFFFHVPFTHWGYIAYNCAVYVINVSIIANYLAQSAYEHIKGKDEEYEDNVQMNIIDATVDGVFNSKN